MSLAEETKAPSFNLPSDDGSSVSLQSILDDGKWAIVYFYPKAGDQGCTTQAKNYQQDYGDYCGTGAEVVGVSTDSVDKLKSFKSEQGVTFPLLSDKDGAVAEAYQSSLKIPFLGTFAKRNTFIIDPQGMVRKAYTSVDPKMDSIVVFAQLKELQNPK